MGKRPENFPLEASDLEAHLAPENLERIFDAYKTDEYLAAFLARAIFGQSDFNPTLTLSDVENFYTTFPTLKVFREKFNIELFIDTMTRTGGERIFNRKNLEKKDFDGSLKYQRGGERFAELMYPGEMEN